MAVGQELLPFLYSRLLFTHIGVGTAFRPRTELRSGVRDVTRVGYTPYERFPGGISRHGSIPRTAESKLASNVTYESQLPFRIFARRADEDYSYRNSCERKAVICSWMLFI